jgi:hypothetical protein
MAAEHLLAEGMTAYGSAQFDKALDRLSLARSRTEEQALLAKICLYLGLAHHGLNQPGAARNWFVEALTQDPELELDPEQFKPALVSLLEEARRSLRGQLSVTVSGGAGDRRLMIDGREVSSTSFIESVPIGPHRIELVDRDGRRQNVREVIVHAGQTIRLKLPGQTTEPSSDGGRTWTWVGAGGAIVSLGLAVGFGLAAQSAHDDGRMLIDQGLAPGQASAYQELDESLDQRRLASNISWTVFGVLVAATTALFFLEDSDAGPSVTHSSDQTDVASFFQRVGLRFAPGRTQLVF